MLVTHLLAILALAHFTSAFYPYMPPWRCVLDDGCEGSVDTEKRDGFTVSLKQRVPNPEISQTTHADHVQLAASRLRRKFNRGTPVESSTKESAGHLEKRFNIVTAVTPSQTLSAGIDQDGTDYSYFAEILIGTSTQHYKMLLDTGAGQTWVMGSSCTSTPCTSHSTFGPSDSTTYKSTDKTFSVQYGTGAVSGVQVTDSIAFAGLKLNMTFGLANKTSDEFNNFPIDGIIGLSRMTSNSPNFVQALVSSKQLKSNIFGVALSRSADGATNTGEINFGAVDTSRFSGELSYTPVSENEENDWAIPIDNIGVGSTKSAVQSATLGYVDTGTSFIFASPADVKLFHAVVPGAVSSDGATWTVPCTTTDSAFVTFSGVTYKISSEDWVGPKVNGKCTSNIYGIEVVTGAWLLGDVFLKNVYAVFDADESRLGLAARSVPTVPSATPSSTTGVSTGAVSTSALGTATGSATSTSGSLGMNGHQTSLPSPTGSAVADSTSTSKSGTAASTTSTSSSKSAGSRQFSAGIFGAVFGLIAASILT